MTFNYTGMILIPGKSVAAYTVSPVASFTLTIFTYLVSFPICIFLNRLGFIPRGYDNNVGSLASIGTGFLPDL
jgi:hypothetical protein